MWPEPVPLEGELVRIEPLRRDHHDGIVGVVNDGELWNLWYTKIPRPENVADDIKRRLSLREKGSMPVTCPARPV